MDMYKYYCERYMPKSVPPRLSASTKQQQYNCLLYPKQRMDYKSKGWRRGQPFSKFTDPVRRRCRTIGYSSGVRGLDCETKYGVPLLPQPWRKVFN